MTLVSNFIVYPEGDVQEISHTLRVDQIIGLNGVPLQLPLPTSKMIAYRVSKIVKKETKGEINTYYHLELLRRADLLEYT